MSVPSDKKTNTGTTGSQEDIKPALRRSLLDIRRSLDDATRADWDKKISAHITHHLHIHAISSLGVYFSTRNEPDLMELYVALSEKGMPLSLPVVMGKASPLQFARWKPGDPMTRDSFGISTPKAREFVPLPEALLVPCLGFTPERFRLGYGGGYFDRTLEQTPRPHTIGIAYTCLKADFPVQEYDIPMDCIITETGTIQG
ncbi:5-formyltetrahydrofolate cyclo-ligase [Oxalobacter sp. OttesenSCG-928-P03]|nr:5-formyltetrahydrofolate cyclo-ligase [Oxalobacter sp. OttesenSCG-928-P03]